jgi:hypothetical protein
VKKIAAALLLVTGLAIPLGATSASASPKVDAHGGARQAYATGLRPGVPTALVNAAGHRVAKQAADSLGGVVFRDVKPGNGYRIVQAGQKSAAITVHRATDKPWDPGVYNQSIPDHGYGYLKTRDGTKLAYYVHPPTSPAGLGLPDIVLPSGLPDFAPPYPTLIEYAGYGYANPAGPESGIAIIANLMGFAVVDVNMRGTGCSGGSFNFFERMQSLDGDHIVETLAHQPGV